MALNYQKPKPGTMSRADLNRLMRKLRESTANVSRFEDMTEADFVTYLERRCDLKLPSCVSASVKVQPRSYLELKVYFWCFGIPERFFHSIRVQPSTDANIDTMLRWGVESRLECAIRCALERRYIP